MSRLIRVLHTEWSDGWGGQEIRIINEMMAVRDHGVEVFLACRDNAIIKQKALENDIKVFTLPFRGNADFKTLLSLSRLIKKYDIDIVNTHSGKDTWVGGLAAKFAGAKFIRTRHLSNRIRSSRFNFINELADYIFTTGESVRADMIKYNRIKPERIQSIPTGIDVDIFNPEKYDREACRQELELKEDEIAIGIVAVLRQFKRHDLFLQMAKNLIHQHPKKKLVFFIAGDGPQKENIENMIHQLDMGPNVTMLGHVNEVPELLSALDIIVLCSDSKEGVPQSVMQALLMNKSVVATNSGSTKDLLEAGNFQLVGTDDVNELTRGVSYCLNNQVSSNIRRFTDNHFSKTQMVLKITAIYEQLLEI